MKLPKLKGLIKSNLLRLLVTVTMRIVVCLILIILTVLLLSSCASYQPELQTPLYVPSSLTQKNMSDALGYCKKVQESSQSSQNYLEKVADFMEGAQQTKMQ